MHRKSDICEGVNKPAGTKRDSLLSVAIIACCIIVLIVYFNLNTKKSKENIPYINTFSPEYQQNMDYISNALIEASDKLPDGWSGYFGAHIPIVQEQDFPYFTQRLKKELRRASTYTSMFHLIVVGGMNVRDIDEPILEASKRFRAPRMPNVVIIIVAPSTISNETKTALEKKGIGIRLVEPPSRDYFH